MKTMLTPGLLRFLINEGYQLCLSKTTNITTDSADVYLTLTPVKCRPSLKNLRGTADNFFAIKAEPMQLAEGVKDTLVFINVTTKTLLQYSALDHRKIEAVL